jgi:hypothetical protein
VPRNLRWTQDGLDGAELEELEQSEISRISESRRSVVTNESGGNGHAQPDDEALSGELEPGEYDAMLLLERLESLEEDMEELGVRTLEDVRRRIAELNDQLDREG